MVASCILFLLHRQPLCAIFQICLVVITESQCLQSRVTEVQVLNVCLALCFWWSDFELSCFLLSCFLLSPFNHNFSLYFFLKVLFLYFHQLVAVQRFCCCSCCFVGLSRFDMNMEYRSDIIKKKRISDYFGRRAKSPILTLRWKAVHSALVLLSYANMRLRFIL